MGIDAAGNVSLRILAQREVGLFQRQGVGSRVIGHGAVAQHVVLVGFRYLRACYPEVVGFAFLLVRVHIRQLQIGVVCLFDFKKAVKFFLHAGVDFRITRVIVGAIPEPVYVLSDAQPTQAEVHTDSRHIQEQVAAVVGQMTLFPDVLLRMDHQLAAMVHGSEIGDAAFCICDLHLAIDLNASPADARLETLQRDLGIGSNRCSRVSTRNSFRRIVPIGIGEIVFSPYYLLCSIKAVAICTARHLAVCHQPQIFFTEGFDQRRIIRVRSCIQRHISVKGQKTPVIGYRTLNAFLTIDRSVPLRIQKYICHPASCSHRRAARQCQRGCEVQREGCGKHPGEEFLPSSFHCKSLLFLPILLQEKSSTVHF